jgi:hypothetical protein
LKNHIYFPYLWKYVRQEILTNAEVDWVEWKLGCSLLYFDFRLPSNRVRNRSVRIKNFSCPHHRWAGIAQSVLRFATGWTVRESIPVGGWDFPHPSKPPLGPPSLLHKGYRVFPGGKAAGAWRWPPTPSSAEVKERVQLYIYSLSVPS